MKNEITSKEYWEQTGVFNNRERDIPTPIAKLLKKFLKKNKDDSAIALEIGCAPGTFLAYICKEFNYHPEGVDYAKGATEVTNNTITAAGLPPATIHKEDFFTWQPNKKYDLVSSFGFIEHFYDLDIGLEKHISILKEGGTIVLEVPSFSYGQYFLHKWLDRENLERCNIEAMRASFLKKIAERYNLKTKYLGYTGGIFDFWWENDNPTVLQNIIRYLLKPAAFIGRKIPIHNKYFSPFAVLIAKK